MRFTLVLAVVSMFTLVKTWEENNAAADLRQRRAASGDSEASSGRRVARDAGFKPKVTGPPPCAHGSTFCTEADDYPAEHLSSVLSTEDKFKDYFGVDKEEEESAVQQRIGADHGDSLCKAQGKLIFPKMAQNKDNEWLFIVNLDQNYVQGIHVEICEQAEGPCELSQSFPPGYGSFCVQRYTYRKLIAVNDEGKPAPDTFKLPTCCSCFYRKTSVGSRILSANNSSISRPRG